MILAVRVIIYTGKGGVGKTSVAAATALAAAQRGLKTVVMSTDAAHSLGDCLGVELGDVPKQVAENLAAVEINSYRELELNWGAVREHIARLVALQGLDEVLADEIAVLPGMDELFSLARIKDLAASYDLVVVDAASSGETLRLLALPQTLSWTVKLLRRARAIVKPFAAIAGPLEDYLAPEEVFEALDEMLTKLRSLKSLLGDTVSTSVRLVLNPEKVVIQESKRTLTYLSLYGLLVDAVIVNRVLSKEAGYLDGWRLRQNSYVDEISHSFAPLPVLKAPFYPSEVVGLESLEQLARDIFAETDPAALLHRARVIEFRKEGGEYLLCMCLPMLCKEHLRIRSTGSELILQLDNQRRIISLPPAMAGYRPTRARFCDNVLEVKFTKSN
ncbi:MAG: TRC40/GET3/ArsA family transport-energizing ATPase [Acidobacteriota bacterium]|nr:TRC40/GET3/ArsA family transport-energizing ATPase [Blastocatellia bacterium]MDW8411932.1 TRC40/GET3/ArsA family transport-energizing ATPase [Acidobacteriota bacterium]